MSLALKAGIRTEAALWLACQKLEMITGQDAGEFYDEFTELAKEVTLAESETD